MARLDLVRPFSGQASGREEALVDPRTLISRPIFLQEDGTPLKDRERWQLPSSPVRDTTPDKFRKFVGSKNLFVIGGFQFVVEMGLLPSWYCDEATRRDAKKIIEARKWTPILEDLKGRENNSDDIFGQTAIHEFFAHSPNVKRDEDGPVRTKSLSPKQTAERRLGIRNKHPLRLRKAIEFLVLTEAILAYRFKTGKSLRRFAFATGLAENGAYPEIVWDYLWIEPVHYCVSAAARTDDVKQIMTRAELVARFRAGSGQDAGALFYTLQGAPGKFRTIAAACDVLNAVYPGLAKAIPTTVLPDEFGRKMDVFKLKTSFAYQAGAEYVPELGPEPRPR